MGQILGQNNLALFGFKWSWVNEGLLCLYILKKVNGDVNRLSNRPTVQLTVQPTDRQGEYIILTKSAKKFLVCVHSTGGNFTLQMALFKAQMPADSAPPIAQGKGWANLHKGLKKPPQRQCTGLTKKEKHRHVIGKRIFEVLKYYPGASY